MAAGHRRSLRTGGGEVLAPTLFNLCIFHLTFLDQITIDFFRFNSCCRRSCSPSKLRQRGRRWGWSSCVPGRARGLEEVSVLPQYFVMFNICTFYLAFLDRAVDITVC